MVLSILEFMCAIWLLCGVVFRQSLKCTPERNLKEQTWHTVNNLSTLFYCVAPTWIMTIDWPTIPWPIVRMYSVSDSSVYLICTLQTWSLICLFLTTASDLWAPDDYIACVIMVDLYHIVCICSVLVCNLYKSFALCVMGTYIENKHKVRFKCVEITKAHTLKHFNRKKTFT